MPKKRYDHYDEWAYVNRIGMVGQPPAAKPESVNHPSHYGGADNPYEAIKVIEAWGLGFNLGNAVKYISRSGKKGDVLEDLQKSAWYLNREIDRIEEQRGA